VSLNLVGNDNKDKQCVMRYEMPRLKIIFETAVLRIRRALAAMLDVLGRVEAEVEIVSFRPFRDIGAGSEEEEEIVGAAWECEWKWESG
jgi:hypothetical protein